MVKMRQLKVPQYIMGGFVGLLFANVAYADSGPRVADLTVREQDGGVAVSFRVLNAFTDEVREKIESGISISFTHRLQAMHPRWWWWNRKVIARAVVTTVRFDPLTHQYHLTREQDERMVDEWSTDKFQEVTLWMTRLENVPLEISPEERSRITHVRVRTDILERRLLHVLPWPIETPWAQIRLSKP